jgi:prepilin-type N-terminal cleavage/methylation domain-containing protein
MRRTFLRNTNRKTKIPHRQSGFSLLEMLVVLAILGVVTTMVSVRMVTSMEASSFARTANASIAHIKTLRAEALLDNTSLFLVAGDTLPVDLRAYRPDQLRSFDVPDGWTVGGAGIHISKTGFCQGGRVTLQGPSGRKAEYDLRAPDCRATRLPVG